MAETKKAQAKRSKPKASAPSKTKKTDRTSKPQSSARSRTASRPKKRPQSKTKRAPAIKSASNKPQAVLGTIEETAKDAGGKVAGAVSKAKVPLMAGGAALVGAAGGIALGAHQVHRKSGLGKVRSKDLARAARKAGDIGAQVGEVALEVRRARESTNGNGKVHRSPVEVVLQGLTSRGPRG
jgi:hypothetical protein